LDQHNLFIYQDQLQDILQVEEVEDQIMVVHLNQVVLVEEEQEVEIHL
jgi:hypothetical protein